MNGIGVGHFNKYQGIQNAVDGTLELAPSFQKNVSLTNPSTWHNLKFAYLSISYSGNENVTQNPIYSQWVFKFVKCIMGRTD